MGLSLARPGIPAETVSGLPLSTARPGEIRIDLFAVRPDQEYAHPLKPSGEPLEGWDNTWDNGTSYNDTMYDDHKYSDGQVRAKENANELRSRGTPDLTLRELIIVRRDGPDKGFVYNKANDAIFIADSRALDLLESCASRTMADLRAAYPEVLAKLFLG